jgi:hypothetical protein
MSQSPPSDSDPDSQGWGPIEGQPPAPDTPPGAHPDQPSPGWQAGQPAAGAPGWQRGGQPNQPPPGWPPHQPPPGWQPNPPRGNGGLIAGTAVAGAALFIVVNAVAGLFVIVIAADQGGTRSTNAFLAVAAALSALIAFGGGAALIMTRKPVAKGFGLGLMIGWALVTVCTVGFCTGVNPYLYNS